MAERTAASVDALIYDLGADLRPVKRLRSPPVRALAWLAIVALTALVLAWYADLPAMARRLDSVPDMWLAVLGSTLTAVLGAVAVFELSLPDRKSSWAWLPVPGMLLWIGATSMGCLRSWFIPDIHPASMEEAPDLFRLHRQFVNPAFGCSGSNGPARVPLAAKSDRSGRRHDGCSRGCDASELLPPL